MANLSKTTQDHEEIRRWAEERGGKPSHVKSTGSGEDVGILRIDFPGYSGEGSLEEISWEDWFDKFDERNLALLYEETTSGGERSNFNKIVSGATAAANEQRAGRSRATKKGGTAAKKGGAATKKKAVAPAKKSASVTNRTSARKSATKKAASKTAAKKATPTRGATKKAAKAAPRKVAAKKVAAKKVAAKKVPAAKKTAPAKKAVKKTAAKKRR